MAEFACLWKVNNLIQIVRFSAEREALPQSLNSDYIYVYKHRETPALY